MNNSCALKFEDTTFAVAAALNGKHVGRTTQMVSIAEIASKLNSFPDSLIIHLVQANCPLYSIEGDVVVSLKDLKSTIESQNIPICSLGESTDTCELFPHVDKSITEGFGMLEATYRIFDLYDIAIKSGEAIVGEASALLNVAHYSQLTGVDSKSAVGETLEHGYPVYSIGDEVFIAARDLAACLED